MLTLTLNGQTINATQSQIDAIVQFQVAKSGFGAIKGYIPTTEYEVCPVQDEQFCAKFSLESYYRKINEAIASLKVSDLDLSSWIPSKGKDACDNAADQLELCKAKMTESNLKTLNGIREDAHRHGHDACHIKVCDGVKVHLVTETTMVDGRKVKRPVLDDKGNPTADCIRVSGLSVRKVVVKKGVRKVKNSGSKVKMDNAIMRAISGKVCQYKSYSLRAGNFERVRIGGQEVTEIENEDKRSFLASVTC